jgi:IS30 family transposase
MQYQFGIGDRTRIREPAWRSPPATANLLRRARRSQSAYEISKSAVTIDNGTEFAHCHRLAQHVGMKLYYADPGGRNENTKGLIRVARRPITLQ